MIIRVHVSDRAFCGAQLDNLPSNSPLRSIRWESRRCGRGTTNFADVDDVIAHLLAEYLDLDPFGVDPELAPAYRAAQAASTRIYAQIRKASRA